ncbi:MAG: hypothetical protein J6S80_01540 [Alphaproteobacteria bacterium]|nr:hypothetical protein [Alphaproteobacteria bacterium]
MFDKLKMKFAARRMQRENDYAMIQKNVIAREHPLMTIISWPFRVIGRVFRWIADFVTAILSWIWDLLVWLLRTIWAWICGINLVGLINLALLIAIIVLCSLLIISLMNNRKSIFFNNATATDVNKVTVETVQKTEESDAEKLASENKNIPLPIRRDARGDMQKPINVVSTKPCNNPTLRPQGDGRIYGDVIIESRGERIMLRNGARIRGNLYLQRMRKYVLPCNVVVEGDVFLRDVNLLQFCGPFTITGNIYVSPRSSFGPIPYNSKLGGQIIL